jgi:hypothetical protein
LGPLLPIPAAPEDTMPRLAFAASFLLKFSADFCDGAMLRGTVRAGEVDRRRGGRVTLLRRSIERFRREQSCTQEKV